MKRDFTKLEVQRIINLHNEGYSYYDIGKIFGCGWKPIRRVLNEHNAITWSPRKPSSITKRKIGNAMKRIWENNEFRVRGLKILEKARASITEKTREKLREVSRKYWTNDEHRKEASERARRWWKKHKCEVSFDKHDDIVRQVMEKLKNSYDRLIPSHKCHPDIIGIKWDERRVDQIEVQVRNREKHLLEGFDKLIILREKK
jgi:hypothetical protein